ncbi:MAG: pilus assembly protein PilP [Burkholderiaceae bacterium]
MTGVRDNTQPVTRTIAEPRKFQPYRYDLIEATGPFSPEKLAILQDPMQVRARGGLAPDVTRRRELLESFPLEQIHMVGSMRNQQVSAALLKVEETVYTARVGSFAGQNYGRITAIDETEIRLRELVQDAAGEWVEREATLRLQETGDETGR